jgi:hypothetical protein
VYWSFFNFDQSIIHWVKVFYNNIKSAIIQGGNLSTFSTIQRGCRQDNLLSPYIFILCAEILAIKIRGNKNISGIKVTEIEHKLSQFADDTSLILDGNIESSTSKSARQGNLWHPWVSEISLSCTFCGCRRFPCLALLPVFDFISHFYQL